MNLEVYNNIVNSDNFKREMAFMQHGKTTVYGHSINVAKGCVAFAKLFNMKVNYNSLVKGALLHDYFLYDWHIPDKSHRLHGITHPVTARNNAQRDFGLTKVEENMILSHMFPLRFTIPRYKESIILCIVDKYCALGETVMDRVRKVKEIQ